MSNPEEERKKRKRMLTEGLAPIHETISHKKETSKEVQYFKKIRMLTEAKSRYSTDEIGPTFRSNIKDKGLTKLKYEYKSIAHS